MPNEAHADQAVLGSRQLFLEQNARTFLSIRAAPSSGGLSQVPVTAPLNQHIPAAPYLVDGIREVALVLDCRS